MPNEKTFVSGAELHSVSDHKLRELPGIIGTFLWGSSLDFIQITQVSYSLLG